MRVSLLVTCVVDLFAPDVGVAAVRLLRAAGCEVGVPLGQTCCGQPAWNAGFASDAARVARTTLEALEADLAAGSETVVVPAGSCAAMVKVFWPELFDVVGQPGLAARARTIGDRTYELSSFLAGCDVPGLRPRPGAPVVAYHHSCHMLRELGVAAEPEALLDAAGCARADWPDDRRCCGFGGLFSVKLPEASVAMADEKLRTLPPEATVLVGSDASCLMHLRGRLAHERGSGAGVPAVRHLADVLADALIDPVDRS